MQNQWANILGVVAAFIGAAHLENARRGLFLRPVNLFWSGLAAYLAYQNVRLYESGGTAQLVCCSLVFCAASPFLGYLWWGRDGEIRRQLYRTARFLFLTAICILAWSVFLGVNVKAVMLGIVTGTIFFIPYRRIRYRLMRPVREWRRRRKERRIEAREDYEEQKQRALPELERIRNRYSKAERKLRTKDRRIASLKRREEKQEARLSRQRREIAEQVQVIRAAEVEQIQQGIDGLQFHPDFGFLMAESWRVLRAQIARGERMPAVEHDSFFHQVVGELLKPEEFEARYFHREGYQAIAAVNRYVTGEQPLAVALLTVEHLRLLRDYLAPSPLEGEIASCLLEAWLVPHRRRQDRLREDFQLGRHPYQVQIIEFLRKLQLPLPDQEKWRELWDEHPTVFMKPGAASLASVGRQ